MSKPAAVSSVLLLSFKLINVSATMSWIKDSDKFVWLPIDKKPKI